MEQPQIGRGADSIAAVVAVFDDGTLQAHVERFCALTAVPSAVVASGRVSVVVAWLREHGDETGRSIADLVDAPARLEARGEIRSTDGRVVEWVALPLAGPVHGASWSFFDTSFHHAAARALLDAESWLRLFAAHQDGVVLEVDGDARVVATWAAAAGAPFGLAEATLRGRTFVELLGPSGGELDRRVRGMLADGQATSFELAIDVNGDSRVVAVNAVPLSSGHLETPRGTVLVRDVTQQVRLKAQLEQTERLASLGILAAGVAHEINNPLGYMLLNLERVRRQFAELGQSEHAPCSAGLFGELDRSLAITLDGARRVQRIVRDLKHFARSHHDEPPLAVDVRRVLRGTLDMVARELEQRARVVCDLDPVPTVLATEGRLAQVVLNLLLNAMQAVPDGDPAGNEIRIVTGTDARGDAFIEVRDTGVGVPDHVARHIFDPFFTTKPPEVGTGLGLSICHGITTAFGGSISVAANAGRGSVFRVVLPAADVDA